MSNLVNHAVRELDIIGYPATPVIEEGFSIDYEHEIRKSVLKIVEEFASQGHSGMSASITLAMLTKLLDYKPLSPLTDNPNEWNQVDLGGEAWQSQRNPEAFSTDGGKTYYLLSEERRWVRKIYFAIPKRLRQLVWKNRRGLYPVHISKVIR
jgi:hypothetical protein